MRPKAGLKLRKLQDTHGLLMYPSLYNGVQMFKELKDELANLHDAYDSDEHERKNGKHSRRTTAGQLHRAGRVRRQGEHAHT
eukprot:1703178-Pleurochrysis_carterae.AAC.2